VRETAKRLWLIYVALTALLVLLLLPAMTFFDAVNHAFATMATGGFSTENGSVGQYGSAYVDWVITAFMALAGINFALHYRLLHAGGLAVWRDTELRVYLGILLAATAAVVFALWQATSALLPQQSAASEGVAPFEGYDRFADALRYAAFQVVAIVTTTGFGTADYELWPSLAVFVVFAAFFVGGMAGSTGGGIKVVRQVLLFKNSYKEIKQLVHPHAVLTVRLGERVVPREILKNVLSFIVLYFGLIALGTLAMSLCGFDLLSAFSASFSSVGNVGPAFGAFGPTETYAPIPDFGKWTLALLMMAGRLEIFTVLILFMPTFWQR
jgi:trk system potassium uptake protein TrkH